MKFILMVIISVFVGTVVNAKNSVHDCKSIPGSGLQICSTHFTDGDFPGDYQVVKKANGDFTNTFCDSIDSSSFEKYGFLKCRSKVRYGTNPGMKYDAISSEGELFSVSCDDLNFGASGAGYLTCYNYGSLGTEFHEMYLIPLVRHYDRITCDKGSLDPTGKIVVCRVYHGYGNTIYYSLNFQNGKSVDLRDQVDKIRFIDHFYGIYFGGSWTIYDENGGEPQKIAEDCADFKTKDKSVVCSHYFSSNQLIPTTNLNASLQSEIHVR